MRAVLLTAVAVLTLSIATAAFAKEGGDGGQNARQARSSQYYVQ